MLTDMIGTLETAEPSFHVNPGCSPAVKVDVTRERHRNCAKNNQRLPHKLGWADLP